MAVNPVGFVQVQDFGNPRVFQGKAKQIISGGQLVGASGANAVVSSGAASYVTNDVEFIVNDDAENFVGIAMQTTLSGQVCPVDIDSVALVRCAGSVLAGRLVKTVASSDAVETLGSTIIPADANDAASAGNIAGRALTAGASGGYALVYLHA